MIKNPLAPLMIEAKKTTSLHLLQKECIDLFCHSDEAPRVDSNSMRVVNIIVDDEKVKHPGQVWEVVTWAEKHVIFLESEAPKTHIDAYPNFRTPKTSIHGM